MITYMHSTTAKYVSLKFLTLLWFVSEQIDKRLPFTHNLIYKAPKGIPLIGYRQDLKFGQPKIPTEHGHETKKGLNSTAKTVWG